MMTPYRFGIETASCPLLQTIPLLRRRRVGFTLVELLVVIGIIALLISILLPALSKAQQQSRTVACLSNIRQITMAAYNYSSENKGICVPPAWRKVVGTGFGDAESWPNILVDTGYLTAPNAKGKGPQTARSVFYCPSGNSDFNGAFTSNAGLPNSVPSSRTDGNGATSRRCSSSLGGPDIDVWYGINGSTGGGDKGSVPLIRVPDDNAKDPNDLTALRKMSAINRSSETVFLFDGIYMNLGVNSARVNARHGRQNQTNLGFFDGHAQTYRTIDLPGGIGKGNNSDFSLKNLDANYPTPAPKWRLNQN
jgi:prepilin-type N-terminal cleavage/methylation domain-containing protein/prepilin-type processing-associated H-X9-DG protein